MGCAMTVCIFSFLAGGPTAKSTFPTRRSSDLPSKLLQRLQQFGKRVLLLDRHQLATQRDRKSTRLNSSHPSISYADFCLKKKTSPKVKRNIVGDSTGGIASALAGDAISQQFGG